MTLSPKVTEKKNNALPVNYKSISFTPENLSITGRIVCGYLAAFKTIDEVLDRLIKGCFAKSLAERGVGSTAGNKIAHLWQHKMDLPLGNYKVLEERDYGLYFECEYDDIQRANDALVQFKSGTLRNFSIGYCYVWDKMEWNNEDQCFDIFELELHEGSVVTLACNADALFTGLKSSAEVDTEINILKEEANELISTLKPRKRYELGQIFSKLLALSQVKPSLDSKEALKQEAEKKKREEEAADASKKKKKFSKLSELK